MKMWHRCSKAAGIGAEAGTEGNNSGPVDEKADTITARIG